MRLASRVLILAITVLSLAAGRAAAQSAILTVDVDRPGVKVSPTLYGIFFEEINMAGDGGLYAELVRNRSFEDAAEPVQWRLLLDGSAKGQIAVDTRLPMSAKNSRSLRMTVAPGGNGRVGIVNDGYYGIAVQKGAEYVLSLAARAADGFNGPLTATLEDGDGKTVYAKATIDGLSGRWKTFKLTLKSAGNNPKARLVLATTQPGTVWLDMVSLFPQRTWKGRPNGLRPDLAEMLAALRPAFVRFPGGCWVEGDSLEFAQRWKTTIGDLSERRTLWNIWQYFSTNGLGYHEYLQLCEDLAAEPLFVINCGMAHKDSVPLDTMGPWVQDALDAIEYANGPADSKWGSLRAKAGHPAPFGLKYIEVGNENGGQAYQERYPLFYDAIKARYPTMTIIADCPTHARPADVVDEHYYATPEFFISNAHKYDGYDRKGPKIYVGEYAVTEQSGQGNLAAAIGEAAFMTGLERNSDVVTMSSYAPLFANVSYKKWNPDLIDFDSSRVYGIPSYYVQQMFSRNRGDVVLPAKVETPPQANADASRGQVGLGTWATQAEFKDVKVVKDGKAVFASDFSKGLDGWKVQQGDWKAVDGVLRQTGNAENCRILLDSTWDNYTLSLKARKLGGSEGFLILFGAARETAKSWWNIGGWDNTRHALENARLPQVSVPGSVETGRWYDVRIETAGPTVRCYLDGKLMHEAKFADATPLHVVAGRINATGEVVLKIVNVSNAAQDTEINLRGAETIESQAKVTVLTSASAADENTLDAPRKVAPVTLTIDNAAKTFRHTFPPLSVTILRLKAKNASPLVPD